MMFEQTMVRPGEGPWRILTGARGDERLYEASAGDGSEMVRMWGHLVSQDEAVAFVADGFNTPGTFTVAIDGSGQTSFRFGQTDPGVFHAFTLFQHFVSTPVSVGAATSPAAILSPPRVSVEP
jgi:hypothetical protein